MIGGDHGVVPEGENLYKGKTRKFPREKKKEKMKNFL